MLVLRVIKYAYAYASYKILTTDRGDHIGDLRYIQLCFFAKIYKLNVLKSIF